MGSNRNLDLAARSAVAGVLFLASTVVSPQAAHADLPAPDVTVSNTTGSASITGSNGQNVLAETSKTAAGGGVTVGATATATGGAGDAGTAVGVAGGYGDAKATATSTDDSTALATTTAQGGKGGNATATDGVAGAGGVARANSTAVTGGLTAPASANATATGGAAGTGTTGAAGGWADATSSATGAAYVEAVSQASGGLGTAPSLAGAATATSTATRTGGGTSVTASAFVPRASADATATATLSGDEGDLSIGNTFNTSIARGFALPSALNTDAQFILGGLGLTNIPAAISDPADVLGYGVLASFAPEPSANEASVSTVSFSFSPDQIGPSTILGLFNPVTTGASNAVIDFSVFVNDSEVNLGMASANALFSDGAYNLGALLPASGLVTIKLSLALSDDNDTIADGFGGSFIIASDLSPAPVPEPLAACGISVLFAGMLLRRYRPVNGN
jgi:hypothetical protein